VDRIGRIRPRAVLGWALIALGAAVVLVTGVQRVAGGGSIPLGIGGAVLVGLGVALVRRVDVDD